MLSILKSFWSKLSKIMSINTSHVTRSNLEPDRFRTTVSTVFVKGLRNNATGCSQHCPSCMDQLVGLVSGCHTKKNNSLQLS
ncbi:hypothetical protein Hdeb2414_s0003g00086301 [Helianthus debilis subsp. tardiflorus]